jgi:hypothetical protein
VLQIQLPSATPSVPLIQKREPSGERKNTIYETTLFGSNNYKNGQKITKNTILDKKKQRKS